MFHKLLSLFSAAALISTSVSFSAFADAADSSIDLHTISCVAEDDPSEYGYLNYKLIDENGNEFEPFNLKSGIEKELQGTLPAKYSLVDAGYLPPVRNQGSEGSCWAHAGMAMAESSMIMQRLASASSVDYSEKHLAWFAIGASAPAGDPLYGDFSGLGTSAAYDGGGNMVDVMFTLMSWIGVEQESAVPYRDFGSGVDESYRYHSYAHLQNVNQYDKTDMVSIKNAIMRDGAVQIAYYASSNYLTPNSAGYAAYYCPTSYTSNHSITVVGWDDNFSKSNFTVGGTPSSNGAWLCRNSWGPSWGTNGYFYMSYEDATVGGFASLTMEPTSNYGKVYQYDGGCTHSGGYVYSYNAVSSTGISGAANVFTASDNDELTAVSYYTPAAGLKYTIKIYNNLTGNTPGTGTLVSAATVSGTADYAGYHTVKLNTNVPITKGKKFAVSVDLYNSSTGVHYAVTDMNNPGSGLSYFCLGGSWEDCTDYAAGYKTANIRVKAYTKSAGAEKPANVKATPGDGNVTVTWSPVTSADAYHVFIYYNGNFAEVDTITDGRTTSTIYGLVNGETYGFLVLAQRGDAWSEFTNADIVYATPLSSKPYTIAYAGDSCACVQWTNSGADEYHVFIYYKGNYAELATVPAGTTEYPVYGLVNGETYGFLVLGVKNGVWSEFTEADNAYATPGYAVAQPVTKAYAGDSCAFVQWTDTRADEYHVFIRYNDAYAELATLPAGTTEYPVYGLVNGETYGFLVLGVKNGVWSEFTESDNVYATPGYAVTQPVAKAFGGDHCACVQWIDTGADEYHVFIYYNGAYAELATLPAGTTEYPVYGLRAGETYGFLVLGVKDGVWSEFTAADHAYATTLGVARPYVIAYAGNSCANVRWTDTGADEYHVFIYYNGAYAELATVPAGTFEWNVFGLVNGETYGFLVLAVKDGQWSEFNEATDNYYITL